MGKARFGGPREVVLCNQRPFRVVGLWVVSNMVSEYSNGELIKYEGSDYYEKHLPFTMLT